MLVTQKIMDTILVFQTEMRNQNIDVEGIQLSQPLTQEVLWERIEKIFWINLIK